MTASDYALGTSPTAQRRLSLQGELFADASEQLLDRLGLEPRDRVVELGCGSGDFSRRVLDRLGPGGVLVGVDYSPEMLDEAARQLGRAGSSRFEPVTADIRDLGDWLDQADAVVSRTALHHVPMVETLIGRLGDRLPAGTRIGFLEPEFRLPSATLARQIAAGRDELLPLVAWARSVSTYYQGLGLSPTIGAGLAGTLAAAGFEDIEATLHTFPAGRLALDNILLFYDEIRERYIELEIMTADELDEQKRLVEGLRDTELPPAWGLYQVTAVAGH